MARAFRRTFSTAFVSKRAHGGVGLAGMRERIHELGGRMEMDSDSHGTQVVATMPRVERKAQPKNCRRLIVWGRTLLDSVVSRRSSVISTTFAGSC